MKERAEKTKQTKAAKRAEKLRFQDAEENDQNDCCNQIGATKDSLTLKSMSTEPKP